MSEMRDGLETAEQAIYDSLALALPGAVALAGGICVLAPDTLGAASGFAAGHPWLALAACYIAGYPIQSLSRPIDKGMVALPRGLVWLVRQAKPAWGDSVLRAWHRAGKWLQRGHRPEPEEKHTDGSLERVQLAHLEHAHWHARLGLKPEQRLDPFDVKNLSFSTLGGDQRRLHRFRATTSLNRAMAAISGVAFWISFYLDARWGHWNLAGLAIAAASAVAFIAFRERANMYDGLWNSIIGPQYLANTARTPAPDASLGALTTSTMSRLLANVPAGHPTPSSIHAHTADANGVTTRVDHGNLHV